MAGINQYLPFAYDAGATVQSPVTYAAETLRADGHQPGVALVEVANTTWRQTSVAAAGIAALVVQEVPASDMLDDGSVNNFRDKLKAALEAIIADNQYWKTGDVKPTFDPADQDGWVFADARAISRTGAGAALFAKIGIQHGAGDGSTTFNVPDLRAEFLRGVDAGRGFDPSRVLGSYQGFSTAAPQNAYPTRIEGGSLIYGGNNPSQVGFARRSKSGEAVTASGFDADSSGLEIDAANVVTGDSETRPINVAVRYLIKL